LLFSDDMDGLRKVPDNVPNKDLLAQHLGKPLTAVPDPFGTHESFGAHNNARLRGFLDRSASTTSSSRRPTVHARAASTRRC
jgi:lysyl-tRNA synthetase class 1